MSFFQKILNILSIFYFVISQLTIFVVVGLGVLSLLEVINSYHANEPMLAALCVAGFCFANLLIMALVKFIYEARKPD